MVVATMPVREGKRGRVRMAGERQHGRQGGEDGSRAGDKACEARFNGGGYGRRGTQRAAMNVCNLRVWVWW